MNDEKNRYSSSALSRSLRMARSTPGYCTFTATIRPSRSHRPVHLADRRRGHRHRAPLEEDALGVGAELGPHHRLGQARRHRRHVGLERGQRRLRLRRQALGDEADQLADLHDGALHVAQLAGDVLGRADGELLLEGGAPFGVESRAPHLHRRPVSAATGGQPPDPSRAFDAAPTGRIGQRAARGDSAGHDPDGGDGKGDRRGTRGKGIDARVVGYPVGPGAE